MHGLAPLERGRRHAISKPRLLQRPAYAEVAHKAPRRLRNPVESRQHQIAHRHLLSGPSRARGPTTRLTTNLEPPLPVRRLPLRVDLSRPIVGARTAGIGANQPVGSATRSPKLPHFRHSPTAARPSQMKSAFRMSAVRLPGATPPVRPGVPPRVFWPLCGWIIRATMRGAL